VSLIALLVARIVGHFVERRWEAGTMTRAGLVRAASFRT